MRRQSLRQWLTLRFVWVAALPLTVVAALVWLWLAPLIRADFEMRHQALARAVTGQIETYLLGVQRQIDAVAILRRNLGDRPTPDWFGLLDAHVGTGEVFEAIYMVDAADAVHSVGLPESLRDRREDLIGLDLSRRDFLHRAREHGERVWSGVFLSAVTGRLAVVLAVPVVDQAIVGEIAIEPLAALLSKLPGESDLLALILDHRGQIIAHSGRAFGGQQFNLSDLPIIRDALRGQFATRSLKFEGEAYVGTVIGVPQVDWTVLIAQPQRAVFRLVSTVLWVMVAGVGVLLLLATLAGWELARDFSKRFASYIEQAGAIASGDYDRPWPTSHIVEFADLANDLQRMSLAIRQRERAILASEARFRDLSAMASDWFWEQDDQFRFTFFSSGVATLGLTRAGIVPSTLLGKTRWEMPIDMTAEQWAAHRSMLEAHQPFRDFEYRLFLSGGAERWFSVNGQPRCDAAGRFVGYRGTARDITERKQAEARQRLASVVFEAARDAILVIDAEARIVAVNPTFTAITGYAEAEVRGRTPRLLWADHPPEAYFTTLWRTVLREGAWQGEFWGRCKDGERRAALASLGAVRDAAGRVTHYVGIATDITASKVAEERIEHLAFFDTLTDLPNRALLAQRAELALALAGRHRSALAVLFLDLDRFKDVNDALGHAEGDALLLQVAGRLKTLTRTEDTVCRLGGDEFVLLLPEANQEGALRVADKVLAAFHAPFVVVGHSLQVTVSIGIALYPHDGVTTSELLRNADTALYRAKQDGRNTRVFYDRAMNAAIVERLLLEADLRQALAAGHLRAYFQPKVRLADQALVGVEALMRWFHPERGLIPPDLFIPVAEASDLIIALGDWILAEVCRQLTAWRRQGWPPLVVAVNLAARHFRQPGLADRIRSLLETHGLPPNVLELELTESTLLEIGAQTSDTLRALEQLGVGLAIDDFGTGYSSLSYLKRLPLTALKIDQSFVRDLATDPDDRALAAAIVAIGHQMNMVVVAEGVETEDQRHVLLEQGCDLAQGYLFGRPMPAEEFAGWRARHERCAADPPIVVRSGIGTMRAVSPLSGNAGRDRAGEAAARRWENGPAPPDDPETGCAGRPGSDGGYSGPR